MQGVLGEYIVLDSKRPCRAILYQTGHLQELEVRVFHWLPHVR
jgi:hypothetical protein